MRVRALITLGLACLAAGQTLAQDEQMAPSPAQPPVAQPQVSRPPVSASPDPVRIESQGTQDDAAPATVSPPAGAFFIPSDGRLEQLPIMTLDQDRLFSGSAWGRRVQADLTRLGNELSAENERLLQAFSREEEELTRLRDTLSADEFRIRADEFDRRVVEVRRQRDQARQDLQQLSQTERDGYYARVMPLLARLMQERQALVVLDQRLVLIQAQSIDVTDDLIALVDAEMGAGPDPDTDPAEPAPDTASDAATAPDDTSADGTASKETPSETALPDADRPATPDQTAPDQTAPDQTD